MRRKLTESNLDPGMLDAHPYTISSIANFELAAQIMAQVGIREVMEQKTTGERRLWTLQAVLFNNFREELGKNSKTIFPEDMDRIGPPDQ